MGIDKYSNFYSLNPHFADCHWLLRKESDMSLENKLLIYKVQKIQAEQLKTLWKICKRLPLSGTPPNIATSKSTPLSQPLLNGTKSTG